MTTPIELAQENAQTAVKHSTLWADYLAANSTTRDDAIELCTEAKNYLDQFSWGKNQKSVHVGLLYPGIIAVFLFELAHEFRNVEDWVWVVVGDVPLTYITLEDAPTPGAALDAYIGAMYAWVHAARKGESVEGLVPVNVAANSENADYLQRRLDFLDEQILPLHPQEI
jgi:hypothetical protein